MEGEAYMKNTNTVTECQRILSITKTNILMPLREKVPACLMSPTSHVKSEHHAEIYIIKINGTWKRGFNI
jgi:hypothetical protein